MEFQMSQLVNLAIGSPEIGAVNFNLLQKFLLEMLKLTDLEHATIELTGMDAAQIEALGVPPAVPQVSEEGGPAREDGGGNVRRSSTRIHQCPIDPEKVDQLLEDINQLKFDVEDLTTKVTTMTAATDTVPFQEMRTSLSQIDALQEKLRTLESALEGAKDTGGGNVGGEDRTMGQRFHELEKLLGKLEEQLKTLDKGIEEKLKEITSHFEDVEKELGEINEKVNVTAFTGKTGSVLSRRNTRVSDVSENQTNSINNLLSRLSSVQHDLDNLTMVTNEFKDEQNQRQMIIDVLTEQIETLKIVKADKTNMEDILAAKADMSQVHRKVSHDHFDTKIDELNVLMEDAFKRLDDHEEMWQEEVEDMKVDIQKKLDIGEFSPLRDYVNEKLKTLQEKMKVIAAQRRETLAAGSKKRVIRDVQCISCDNESIMKSHNTLDDVMPAPPLPAQQSVKPYLTYKLDQVRKQQKKLPPGRNLNHFEDMLNECVEKKSPKMFQNVNRSGEHLVNRYVGGSHTTTTPQQRLTRNGNFFETWGPIITAVNSQ